MSIKTLQSGLHICVCERCGHYWDSWLIPKACAKCKNKGWNSPRVYQTKGMTAKPFVQRQKTTWKNS
jgi:hypothetical protein